MPTLEKPYFVILNTSAWNVFIPLLAEDGDFQMATFEYVHDAIIAASNNDYGKEYGYEIFEVGNGVTFVDDYAIEEDSEWEKL